MPSRAFSNFQSLVIASSNQHKVQEIQTLLADLATVKIYSLLDFPNYQPPEEKGHTFEENALLKAQDASVTLNQWALADDSGLVVPALQGRPGLFSARFAGPRASDEENREKLLTEMKEMRGAKREAFFICVMALVSPFGLQRIVTGTVEGNILEKERGEGGFGYDPLFVPKGHERSFAEMAEREKNLISHRARALQKMGSIIHELTL